MIILSYDVFLPDVFFSAHYVCYSPSEKFPRVLFYSVVHCSKKSFRLWSVYIHRKRRNPTPAGESFLASDPKKNTLTTLVTDSQNELKTSWTRFKKKFFCRRGGKFCSYSRYLKIWFRIFDFTKKKISYQTRPLAMLCCNASVENYAIAWPFLCLLLLTMQQLTRGSAKLRST